MRAILLDTNAYSEFKKGHAEATRLLDHAKEVAINVVVLGELFGGFEAGTRAATNRYELDEFLDTQSVRVLEIDSDTAELYAGIFRELRRKGLRFRRTTCGSPPALCNTTSRSSHSTGISTTLTGLSSGRRSRISPAPVMASPVREAGLFIAL